MDITATELKQKLGKFLEAANHEPVIVTKNGKPIAQIIGMNSYRYNFSELEEWESILKAHTFGEALPLEYGSTAVKEGMDAANGDSWILSHNGEPVAQLTPILKQKKKRLIGFIDGPPVSEETDAELLAPIMTDEEYEEWLRKSI